MDVQGGEMLRKLMFAVFGAFLGAVVGLVPAVVDAQEAAQTHTLRLNSEEDVVTVSRRVVGAESLTAPPGNKRAGGTGSSLMAICATGVGVFAGWLLWGRRHEPEVIIHQLEPELVDPEELQGYQSAAGSLFGLSGASEIAYQEDDVPLAPGDVLGVARTAPVLKQVMRPVAAPSSPDCKPPHQPADNRPAASEGNSAEAPALESPPAVETPKAPVLNIESVLESQGLEVVDLDTTDLPWDFDAETLIESTAAPQSALVEH